MYEIAIEPIADVPDPHTLLANIPANASCFTAIDLTGAFFSVRLAKESQGLFGFTFKGQHYRYTRTPQGYKGSPAIFNKALAEDLEDVRPLVTSTVLHFVDDLLIASEDKESCHKDSILILQKLAEKGHKVNRKKLQYCVESVSYLGQKISKGRHRISDEHIEAIRNAPKPRTRISPRNPHVSNPQLLLIIEYGIISSG